MAWGVPKYRKCQAHRGCTKRKRTGSNYCTKHHQEKEGTKWKAAKRQGEAEAPPPRVPGLVRMVDTRDTTFSRHQELRELVVRLLAGQDEKKLRRGVRKVVDVEASDPQELWTIMEELTELARRHLPDVSDPVVFEPAVIVAPAVGNRSNGHTKGVVHGDVEPDCPGHYSFHYFLDEVGPRNGAIAFWPTTTDVARGPDVHKGVPKGHEREVLEGPAGALWVLDARILHQSLPNSTDVRRITISWTVCQRGMEDSVHFSKNWK